MGDSKIDRLGLRVAAIWLAVTALLGWHWFAAYRKDPIDTWELPILSLLLIIAALTPLRIVQSRRARPFVILLLAVDISTLIWWIYAGGAELTHGQYDVGGIVLRVIAYGIALVLLLPKRKKTNNLNGSVI